MLELGTADLGPPHLRHNSQLALLDDEKR